MKKNNILFACCLLLVLVISCLSPYDPPVDAIQTNYLVVDAFLNTGTKTITAKLSRTQPLYANTAPPAELRAKVSLEDESGSSVSLVEKPNGVYEQSDLSVDLTKKYRLHIRTVDLHEYYSEFIPLKQAPPIDSIYWTAESTGIQIYADTHDPAAATRYYRWSFTETWEYTSFFSAYFKVQNKEVVQMSPEEFTYRCWKSAPSTAIYVGSSSRLHEDVISHFPLAFIPKRDMKLHIKYSIEVKQQALTEEAYTYWQQLQQTTENLGGLFDPMPYQITGNMKSATDPDEVVIGFFSGGDIQSKRIFISVYDLPPTHQLFSYSENCVMDTILVQDLPTVTPGTMIISSYGTFEIEGYTTSSISCMDCRIQGGVTTRPDYWE